MAQYKDCFNAINMKKKKLRQILKTAYIIAEVCTNEPQQKESEKWFLMASDYLIKFFNTTNIDISDSKEAANAVYAAANNLKRFGVFDEQSTQLFTISSKLMRNINSEKVNENKNKNYEFINEHFKEETNNTNEKKKLGQILKTAYIIAKVYTNEPQQKESEKWFLMASDYLINFFNTTNIDISDSKEAANAVYAAANNLKRFGVFGEQSTQLFTISSKLMRNIKSKKVNENKENKNYEFKNEHFEEETNNINEKKKSKKRIYKKSRYFPHREIFRNEFKKEKTITGNSPENTDKEKWNEKFNFYLKIGQPEEAALFAYGNSNSLEAAIQFEKLFEQIKNNDCKRAAEYSYVAAICHFEAKNYEKSIQFLVNCRKYIGNSHEKYIDIKIKEIKGLFYSPKGNLYSASDLYSEAAKLKKGLKDRLEWKPYIRRSPKTTVHKNSYDIIPLEIIGKKLYLGGLERFAIILNSEEFYTARSKLYLAGSLLKEKNLNKESFSNILNLFDQSAKLFEKSGSKDLALLSHCIAAIEKEEDYQYYLSQLLDKDIEGRGEFIQVIDSIAQNLMDVKNVLNNYDKFKQEFPVTTIGLGEKIQGLLGSISDVISEYERLIKEGAERKISIEPLMETIKCGLKRFFLDKLSNFFDEFIYAEFPTVTGDINTLEYKYRFILHNKGNKVFNIKLSFSSKTKIKKYFFEFEISHGRFEKEIEFNLKDKLADFISENKVIHISFIIHLNQINYKGESIFLQLNRNLKILYKPRKIFSKYKFYKYTRKIENSENAINKFKVAVIQLDLKNALEPIQNIDEWYERTCRTCKENILIDSGRKCKTHECVLMNFKNEQHSQIIYERIIELFDKARNHGAKFLCLPELSLNSNIINKLEKYARIHGLYITGSYHNLKKMSCVAPFITPGGIAGMQYHLNPSRRSREGINELENHLYNIYYTQYGNIITPICLDIQKDEIIRLKDKPNKIILTPSYNKGTEREKEIIEALCYYLSPVYILFSNCSEYGGSQIFSSRIKSDKTKPFIETKSIPQGKEDIMIAEINWNEKFFTP